MSKQSKKELILKFQEDYIGEFDRRKKSRILDAVCSATGFDRKYAIKRLSGKRAYKPRPVRGKTWCKAEEQLLVEAWNGAGNPCGKYLKAVIGEVLAGLGVMQHVDPAVAGRVRAMSASTMDRILKGKPRTNRIWFRRNRRSGRNEIMDKITCESGERVPARDVAPGDVQVDSVAFGGGLAEGDSFWGATATDRHTQWVEAHASFNLCAANYKPAFAANLENFPFPVRYAHSDNGSELVNKVIFEYMTGRWPKTKLGRSWPCKKNHNAHIEQKNGSVLRVFLGNVRLDEPSLQRQFDLTLEALCLYNNFFRPCVMLLSKTKRPDRNGWIYRYDKPKTHYERVLESGILAKEQAERLCRKRASLNPVQLMELFVKRRTRLFRMQAEAVKKRELAADAAADSALRAAPPGTSGSRVGGQRVESAGPAEGPRVAASSGVLHLTQTNSAYKSPGVLFT
ncbi:MAG: hypothetical protein IJ678_01195 [Kiritimatiellae bacterium]|nr:hypothetical protein [Kiritimatiellia bacterium]